MENESHLPLINKKETGSIFNIIVPECCRLFAESTPRDGNYQQLLDNCPHVSKPIKSAKNNIGL